ncbi:diaminopimelate epimerase [Solihabitans fulvus]|uniref:Diaminopimelate epimerase n=1 Tax=Solihabitans fulvus TaxID=1892852 RepID=A0A5B2XCH9_9PSEU|nr:diaminopimelate epimerase [Solihabitans fulvus]KAA2261458.1 diaminopimelate epimerase [Solihabitans fulvus]
MDIRFSKVHGTGNDYIVVNTADQSFHDWPALARWACQPHLGVGADGLVVLTHHQQGRFAVDSLNPDGTPSEMSVNALRCAAREIRHRYGQRSATLVMNGREHAAECAGDEVSVRVGAVPRPQGPYEVDGLAVYYVPTPNEDAVAMVSDVDSCDVAVLGPAVRRHAPLAHLPVNVNFVTPQGGSELRVRTFEHGVEGETLSSGSGAVSAAVVASRLGLLAGRRVLVSNRSAGSLSVDLGDPTDGHRDVWLAGEAVRVFSGELCCPNGVLPAYATAAGQVPRW